jgi:mono/diheme cytochrome c family protein
VVVAGVSAASAMRPRDWARPHGTDQGAAQVSPSLIAHPEHVQLGLPVVRRQLTLVNPREHDPRAVEEGKALFVSYNCADCHGSDGSGGTGPSLEDGRWHFGSTVGDVYESIEEGRPDGMPAWGGHIPESQVWALVGYVRTLAAGKDVSTENFEGTTVQRGGH